LAAEKPDELPMMDHPLPAAAEIPEGFVPATHGGPYAQELGPFWSRRAEDYTGLGIRIEHRHCNSMGAAHGGFVATLADLALVHAVAVAREKAGLARASLATISLTVDYIGPPKQGCWLEVQARVTRMGSRLAFTEGSMLADGQHVARISAVFAMQERRQA
jgi:uncharacterized protein (TIGR00369 family)